MKAIKNYFYVDDGITGAESEQEAIKLAKEMIYVLDQSFPLCKWISNSENVMRELKSESEATMNLSENPLTSVLGLKWLLKSDEFTYEVKNSDTGDKITKRAVLGKIAQLYDLIGS